jgi:hypothetical protein
VISPGFCQMMATASRAGQKLGVHRALPGDLPISCKL